VEGTVNCKHVHGCATAAGHAMLAFHFKKTRFSGMATSFVIVNMVKLMFQVELLSKVAFSKGGAFV
jgi:hypothetical protein